MQKEETQPSGELKKSASLVTLLGLAAASMIGSGLFFGAAIAAGYAGPASLLSWLVLGVLTVYIGMCFGELVAMFPKAGGIYEYCKQTYGTFPSFMVGWISWVEGNMSCAVLLIAAIEYIPALFPSIFPIEYALFIKIVIGIGIILFLNYITYRGIEASGLLLSIFSGSAIVIVIIIVIRGIFAVQPANYTPFFTASPLMLFVAMFFTLETFFGWEGITYLAEETKNPQKVIPKILVYTCIGISTLTFLMAAVMIGVVPWKELAGSTTATTDVALILFGSIGNPLIIVAIFLALVAGTTGIIVSAPRLILALARDKLFIDSCAAIHPQYNTPHKAILFQTIVAIGVLFLGFGEYTIMLSLLVPIALLMYIPVLLAVPILRWKMPEKERVYKAPFGTWAPILISLLYVFVIIIWLIKEPTAVTTFLISISLLACGIPIYLLLTLYYNPDAIIPMINKTSMLSYWLEDFLLPRKIRKHVLSLFDGYEGKNILEFGSGVGTMTMHLAELVKPGGHIYAVDLSKRDLKILEMRMEKKGHTHIHLIHDEHQVNRVHPDVPEIDMIFSFGMLSYIQDLKKVLKELHLRLPEDGKICFIEYANLYKVLPNVGWLSSTEKVCEVFKENGFSVTVEIHKGFLWDYVIIYGIKSEHGVPYI